MGTFLMIFSVRSDFVVNRGCTVCFRKRLILIFFAVRTFGIGRAQTKTSRFKLLPKRHPCHISWSFSLYLILFVFFVIRAVLHEIFEFLHVSL